jgi:hypothetical protein
MIWIAIRGILRYSWMGPCHWFFALTSFVIVPFIVPFASEDGWLPKCFSWYQTLDNPLDGDNGWQTEHRPWLDKPYNTLSKFQRYWSRVKWLYRNPVYGFEKRVLCAKIDPDAKKKVWGTTGTGDRYSTPPYKTGVGFWTVQTSSGKCYSEIFWFIKLTPIRSFNGMVGWKLNQIPWPIAEVRNQQICTTLRSSKIFV